MYKSLNYIVGAVLLGLLVATPVSAQILGEDTEPIRVSVTPQMPAPGQTVNLEVQGIGTFLGDAKITWTQDGKIVKNGLGERVYSFVAGQLGKLTRIEMTIDSPSVGIFTRSFTFIPSTINLMWEADTSVPPLYRGKALYAPGSNLRVTAFPQVVTGGRTISASSLSYQWKRGGEPVPSQSGKGRSLFAFAGNQLKGNESVSVDVYLGTALVGQGSITIPVTKPQIVLYQRDPLRGVLWNEALPSAISLTTKEITVQAVPYFFSNDSLSSSDLTFEWKLDGRTTTGPNADDGLMTLRQTGEGAGQTRLSVELQNLNGTKLLQSAETAVRMIFGAQSSDGISSFFGL